MAAKQAGVDWIWSVLRADTAHDGVVEAVRTRLRECVKTGVHATLLKPTQTHTIYNDVNGYKSKCVYVDVRPLTRVMELRGGHVLVEGCASLGDICDFTLRRGFVPAVVCEAADFSVGGLIAGLGIQTSSHVRGFFHDTIDAMEVVTGGGERLQLTRDAAEAGGEHADLFYNLPGSMGTLGVVTAAAIRVIPAKPYVLSRTLFFHTPEQLQEAIAGAEGRPDNEFMEGLALSKDSYALVLSSFADEAAVRGCAVYDPRIPGELYYNQHVEEQAALAAAGKPVNVAVPTLSYLFRYERGIWWLIEAYVGCSLLTRTRCGRKRIDEGIVKAQSAALSKIKDTPLEDVSAGCRSAAQAWASRRDEMKKQNGELTADEMSRCMVAQGFAVRTRKIAEMLRAVATHIGIYPVWVCGVRAVMHPRSYGDRAWRAKYPGESTFHVYDIGAYGEPTVPSFRGISSIRTLQSVCDVPSVWGMPYMTEEEIAGLVDLTRYAALRRAVGAEGVFPDYMTKVRTQKPLTLSNMADRDLPKVPCWRLKRAGLYTPLTITAIFAVVLLLLGAATFYVRRASTSVRP